MSGTYLWANVFANRLKIAGYLKVIVSCKMDNSDLNGQTTKATDKEAWGRTKIEKQTFKYTWTINEFPIWLNKCAKPKEYSPTFSTEEHQWHLRLDKSYTHEDHEYTSLYLKVFQSPKSKVLAMYKIGILDDQGQCVFVNESHEPRLFDFDSPNDCWGWSKFIRKDNLLSKENRYLSNDALILFCEVTVLGDPLPSSGTGSDPALDNHPQVTLPECHLRSTNFLHFLQSQTLSDITLTVGTKEFPSHKFMLAAASPVFQAMFQHNMKESLESRVKVEDIDASVFEDFLHFIYTGKVNDLEKNAEDLLVVAERYGVERLKAICEEFLASQLSVENIVPIHRLANLHNANQLKAITIKFFKEHSAEISKSDGFKSLVKDSPHPLMDILQEMMLSKKIS